MADKDLRLCDHYIVWRREVKQAVAAKDKVWQQKLRAEGQKRGYL